MYGQTSRCLTQRAYNRFADLGEYYSLYKET